METDKKLPIWKDTLATDDKSLCRWPGCTRPKAPGNGGRPPLYCGEADEGYQPHTSTTAQRAKKRGCDDGETQVDLGRVGSTARQGVAALLTAMPRFLTEAQEVLTAFESLQSKEIYEAQVREVHTRSQAELEVADAELVVAVDRIGNLEAEVNRKDQQLETARAEVERLRTEKAGLAGERDEWEGRAAAAEEQSGRLQEALDVKSARAERNLTKWEDAAREARDAERNLDVARAALRETQAALRVSDDERARLKEERSRRSTSPIR